MLAKVTGCFPNDPKRFFLVLNCSQNQEAIFFCFMPPFLRFHLVQTAPFLLPLSILYLHF